MSLQVQFRPSFALSFYQEYVIILYLIPVTYHFPQAVRAIRHPERYGPRIADPTMGGSGRAGQSRARGLTRAIVDTFPIIKFSSAAADNNSEYASPQRKEAGVEDGPLEMNATREWANAAAGGDRYRSSGSTTRDPKSEDDYENRASSSHSPPGPSSPIRETRSMNGGGEQPHGEHDVVPAAIGRDTCPICIVDFEDGDDLRILPCEGKHVFHQTCVDPWLLELSSSCPICRQGKRSEPSAICFVHV